MANEYRQNGMSGIHVAPLFVSLKDFPLPEPEPDSFRILFAGRMTRIKGAEVLAQAAALIQDRPVTLTFAGEGPDRAQLQQKYPQARFPGWVPQSDLYALAATHHVLRCLAFGRNLSVCRVWNWVFRSPLSM